MKIYQILGMFCLFQLLSFAVSGQENKTHTIWTELLAKYVDSEGNVNYKGFKNDEARFNVYLEALEKEAPNDSWTENEKLAYWINAYNAYTVKLIVDKYPVTSIKDLGGWLLFVNTAWDKRFIKIEGKRYDLNKIEHGILRRDFEEPRIHFAINCASKSCPVLLNEAYVPDKLEVQLTEQTRLFLSDGFRNQLSTDKAQLSKIFRWFKGDFTKDQSLLEFINRYSTVKLTKDTEIEYLPYDWFLNESTVQ